MSSLNLKFIDSLNFNSAHLADLRKIGEFRGKQGLFSKKSKKALEVLKQHAAIQSIEPSNRLEQITAPCQRIKALVNKSITPKNRSEREISGYRDALSLIHESYAGMRFCSFSPKQSLLSIIFSEKTPKGGF